TLEVKRPLARQRSLRGVMSKQALREVEGEQPLVSSSPSKKPAPPSVPVLVVDLHLHDSREVGEIDTGVGYQEHGKRLRNSANQSAADRDVCLDDREQPLHLRGWIELISTNGV